MLTDQELYELAVKNNCIKISEEPTYWNQTPTAYYYILSQGKYYRIWREVGRMDRVVRYLKEKVLKKDFLVIKKGLKSEYKELKTQVDSLKRNYG